jgi:hypothetical protein
MDLPLDVEVYGNLIPYWAYEFPTSINTPSFYQIDDSTEITIRSFKLGAYIHRTIGAYDFAKLVAEKATSIKVIVEASGILIKCPLN